MGEPEIHEGLSVPTAGRNHSHHEIEPVPDSPADSFDQSVRLDAEEVQVLADTAGGPGVGLGADCQSRLEYI